MKKILFLGFDLQNDLEPYSSESIYKGDKFSKLDLENNPVKSTPFGELATKDYNVDAFIIFNEWIDRGDLTPAQFKEKIVETYNWISESETILSVTLD